jgi:DNA-binding response OmpR family regulator
MKPVVLVVDDDPELSLRMVAELERMDLEVLCALHYEAAVQALEARRFPSVVCVDLELPTRSGYELCEYIRGTLGRARVPILVTSDSAFPEGMACAEEAGADAFMKKPFSMRDFVASVDALLGRTRASEPGARPVEA